MSACRAQTLRIYLHAGFVRSGYAADTEIDPGSSLPCHVHEYDESITIVEGPAKCFVKGEKYELSGLETAFIPTHRPHRFINELDSQMAMIWVSAGDKPGRVILDNDHGSGSIP